MKLINLTLAIGLAGMASGCMVRQTPHSYAAPVAVAQTGYGYPLYYSDGMYWAYQDASWYRWANDHWLMASHAPYNPVFVSRPHGNVHGSVHRPTHSVGHGVVQHGGSHGGHHTRHH